MTIPKFLIITTALVLPGLVIANPFDVNSSQELSAEQKAIQDLRGQLSEMRDLIAAGAPKESANASQKDILSVNGKTFVRKNGETRFSRVATSRSGGDL